VAPKQLSRNANDIIRIGPNPPISREEESNESKTREAALDEEWLEANIIRKVDSIDTLFSSLAGEILPKGDEDEERNDSQIVVKKGSNSLSGDVSTSSTKESIPVLSFKVERLIEDLTSTLEENNVAQEKIVSLEYENKLMNEMLIENLTCMREENNEAHEKISTLKTENQVIPTLRKEIDDLKKFVRKRKKTKIGPEEKSLHTI